MSEPVLRLDGIRRVYRQGEAELEVLKGADFVLPAGRMTALVGPSGAGKSTLLHICGLLEHPTAGEVLIDARPTGRMGDAERTRLRRERIGFVYQFHHLLPDFTAAENVALPQLVAGRSPSASRSRAGELLSRLGLGERLAHRPGKLSGGEQQRVAIARALANAPKLILADEPTGNLDPATAERVFDELLAVVRDTGTAALIATHNPELAARMDEVWRLAEGRLEPA
ncbi:MAG TPA: ABC transporter ATP-binding protein [Geminicoccaceae bacterium]|nr:ABC transporter ATP-binding protein [Geminicoccus sp.]HMU49254.1 ABC transporter ATP-binding protein [Geminicoccaceae bacterium]